MPGVCTWPAGKLNTPYASDPIAESARLVAVAFLPTSARRTTGYGFLSRRSGLDAACGQVLKHGRSRICPHVHRPWPIAAGGAGPGGLSARERELVTLAAQGRTNAEIAAELYISVRTVSSHPDRIRDKTGCRRRADLARLALSAGLV